VQRSLPRLSRVVAWSLAAILSNAGSGPGFSIAWADPPSLVIPPSSSKGAEAEEQAKLSADPEGGTITNENNDQTVIARKNALLEYQTFRVSADEIKYDKTTGSAEASGEVELTQKALRLLARKAAFDKPKSVGTADMVRIGKPPLYLEGQTLTASAGGAKIDNGTLYFNEPDPYGLNIHASSVDYDSASQDITLHGATFRLGPIPFFYLPVYSQERTDRPPVSIQTRFGYRSDLGGFGQSTTFWTKDPTLQPGLLLDYYSKRGVLAGPALKYDFLSNPDWLQSGTFESGYIHDTGGPEFDLLNNLVPTDRYFMDWKHKGSLDGMVDLTSTMYWWSDSNVVRDFRQNLWQDNQLPDNFIEAVHRDENSFLSAFTRYRPNNFELIQERLPEVRYDLMPTQLWQSGVFQEAQTSFVQLEQQSLIGAPTLHSNRFDAYYGLRYPINPNSWITLTPVLGARVTHYQDTLNQQGDFTRFLGQAGFDAEMRAYGLWNYDNKIWGIQDLRHVLRPVLMYRYIPNAQQGQGQIPDIDGDTFSAYPPVIDLNDTRSVDQLYDTNLVRYGFENILQTRDPIYGSRDLLSLNVYNDLLLQRAPGAKAVSDLWTSLGISPADWLHYDVFTRFDPGALTLREIRTRMRILDGEKWAVAFYTENLQHQIDQYWLEAMYRISERYQVRGRWRFDQRLGVLTEQTYALRTRMGNSWDIEYEISYYRGTTNQNGIGFNVRFDLLAF